MAEKAVWMKLDEQGSSAPVKKAIDGVKDAFTALEGALTKSAKAKGNLPDGKQVKVIQARGGGYIFAYVDPREGSSGPVAM